MNEIKILSVVQIGEPFKCATIRGAGFGVYVEYSLANGEKQKGHETTLRKKDLPARIERLNKAGANGALTAQFNEGKFWGTIQTGGFSFSA